MRGAEQGQIWGPTGSTALGEATVENSAAKHSVWFLVLPTSVSSFAFVSLAGARAAVSTTCMLVWATFFVDIVASTRICRTGFLRVCIAALLAFAGKWVGLRMHMHAATLQHAGGGTQIYSN